MSRKVKKVHPLTVSLGEMILNIVAAEHGVTVDEIRSRRKTRPLSEARQAAYAALYQLRTGGLSSGAVLSLPQIAKLTGRADHTSVLYGIKAHEARMRHQNAE